MKKTLLILGAIALVIAIGIACTLAYVVRMPEYALSVMARDVAEFGLEGLRPHLTEEACKKLDTVTSLVDNKLVGSLMGLFGKEDYTELLRTKLQQIRWSLKEITRDGDRAEVILSFHYEDRLTGTVAFSMVYGDDGWKIDSLELPKFDEVNRNSQ